MSDSEPAALTKVLTLHLRDSGATWGDLRAFVKEADDAGVLDGQALEIVSLDQAPDEMVGIQLTVNDWS